MQRSVRKSISNVPQHQPLDDIGVLQGVLHGWKLAVWSCTAQQITVDGADVLLGLQRSMTFAREQVLQTKRMPIKEGTRFAGEVQIAVKVLKH